MCYTIKEVANISGVTVKTLRYYHQINLLIPEKIGINNYRYYSLKNLERLQQILFYKKLSFSLKQIKVILANSSCSRQVCLKEQLERVIEKQKEYQKIQKTLEKSLDYISENNNLDEIIEDLFIGLKG